MHPGIGQTKGTGIRDCLDFVEGCFGKAARDELFDPGVQAAIGLPLDSISLTQRYPSAGYVRLLEWITERFLGADPSRCAEIGAFGVGRDFRGVHGAFIMFSRPNFLLRLAPKIWNQYQCSGHLSVVDQSPNHCIIEIDDYSIPSIHQWYATIGGTVRALRMAGAKDVSTQILCGVGDGSRRLVYRCDWR